MKTAPVPKRICIVYYSSFNSLLYREALALKNIGYDVDIICNLDILEKQIINRCKEFKIYAIQARKKREGKNISYFFKLFLFFFKAFLIITYRHFKFKYQVIHVTSPPDFMVFTAIIPKLFGTKVLLDIHDIGPEFFMRKFSLGENHTSIKILRFIEKVSVDFSDAVMTVTDLWSKKINIRSSDNKSCITLLNVPDDKLFREFRPPKSNSKYFNLFYHGSVEEHFGLDILINAMPEIRKNIPNVRLVIFGGGRLKDNYIHLAKILRIDDIIKFDGFVPFLDLPILLSKADLGIVPTRAGKFSDEALSMKSLEYISLGIPIVISKTKAHRYYYNDSMVKFFIPDDFHSLSMAVISLYNNPSERKHLIKQSNKFIQNFGWHKTKKVYLDTINQLYKGNF